MQNPNKIYNKFIIETFVLKFENNMKKVILVCCILFWFGCKKEAENSTQVKINKDDYLVEKIVLNDKYMNEFFYDSLHRINIIKYSILVDSNKKSISNYKYDSNTVFLNDNQPKLCYLNKKGLVDSSYRIIPNDSKESDGLVKTHKVNYFYDENDLLIYSKSLLIHEIYGGKRIEQTNAFYEYLKNNIVSVIISSVNYNDTTTYTYYLDKNNDLLEFNKLLNFTKPSKNLVKTETSSTYGLTTYDYKFNDLGLVSEITQSSGRIDIRKIFWRKK